MLNFILYAGVAFIWGSTWLAIKYQLGVVSPLMSVTYRFGLSAILLLLYCRLAGLNLRYSAREHRWFGLQGVLLFGFNYWFVYIAEEDLSSGLTAVIFSTIVLFNILNGALFLKSPIRKQVLAGALVGVVGIGLIFKDDILHFSFQNKAAVALLLAMLGASFSSLGNITSARNQKQRLPVMQTNAFGMLYGAIAMFIIAIFRGDAIIIDTSLPYVSSLLYLAVFGSIIGFGSYLKLVGSIGADRAGYIALIFPIIALALATLFEGYVWTMPAVLGIALILAGNFLVVGFRKG